MADNRELLKRIEELEEIVQRQREVEITLRESEEIYRNISQKSFAGIYVVQDGVFCNLNANVASYADYTADELIGWKSDSLIHPDDKDDVKRNARKMLRGESTAPYGFRIVTKKGGIRWIIETVTSIVYGGKPAILGNCMDITEHRQDQEKLRDSENLYRAIFENTGTATIIIEEDSTISLVNTGFVNLSGYKREEWEGKKSWTEFVVPADVERMKTYHHLRRIDRMSAPRNYEFGFVDARGRIRNVILTVDVIPGTKKSVASFADITEHRLAVAKLRESENLYRTIFETTVAATIIIEEDMIISLANTGFINLTGYNREEWEGKKPWTAFVVPADVERMKAYHYLRRTDSGAAPRNYEFGLVDARGRIRDVILMVDMIPGTQKSVASFVDITEHKLAVAKLQESENLYRTIFENTGTATIIVEDDMMISLANSEFESLSGASKEYWEGSRKLTELIDEKDIEKVIRYHRDRRVDAEAAPRNYPCGLVDKQGNKKVILFAVAMIPGTKKSVVSLTDITRQKLTEAALRKREREVQKNSRNLEEMNAALKVLLKQREDDRGELEEKVLSNVKGLVLPYLEKLKTSRINAREMAFVNILEANLINIISPFSHQLSSRYLNLTTRELQVANLIKEGKTSKEIADVMGICEGAISLHRNHIRKKLGLNNKKINLKSHLESLS